MAFCIAIDPHKKIVFIVTDFDWKIKVTALKIRVKLKFVFAGSWIHPFEKTVFLRSSRDYFLFFITIFIRKFAKCFTTIKFRLLAKLFLNLLILFSIHPSKCFKSLIGSWISYPHIYDSFMKCIAKRSEVSWYFIIFTAGKEQRVLWKYLISALFVFMIVSIHLPELSFYYFYCLWVILKQMGHCGQCERNWILLIFGININEIYGWMDGYHLIWPGGWASGTLTFFLFHISHTFCSGLVLYKTDSM